jgi:hypothetical protein
VNDVVRGVAFVGLPPDAERGIRAAIGMLTIAKHLPVPWRVCTVEEADLVIVAPKSVGSQLLLERAIRQRGPVISALVGAADTVPPGCEKLSWPVRGNDLRNLLLTVDERGGRGSGSDGASHSGANVGALSTHEPVPRGSLLDLAYVLKEANEPDSYGCAWMVLGIGCKPLYVAPRLSAFLFEGSLLTLRDRLSDPLRDDSLAITRISEQNLPQSVTGKPLIMLQWLVGILLAQKSLLPWIDSEAAYSLRHWPDFALLQHGPEHQRIAAVLVNHAELLPDIVRLAQVGEHALNEFLNAASLTGRLVATTAPHTAAFRYSPSVGNALLQRLRKALGIGAGG